MAVQRRLAAILAADVAGYSRLMGEDEAGTRADFNAHLGELFEPAPSLVARYALPSRAMGVVARDGRGYSPSF